MLNLFPSAGGDNDSSSRSSRRKRTPARSPVRPRPEVEFLENRLVPAAPRMVFVHTLTDGPDGSITHIVGKPSNYFLATNLRTAVDLAQTGDVIELDNTAPNHPYQLSGGEGFGGELDVTVSLTIKNNGGGISTIDGGSAVVGGPAMRVFEISGGEAAPNVVTMTGLRITHGNGNGSGLGGGILIDNNAQLTLNSDIVTSNTAAGDTAQGGGIANFGTLAINGSTISLNTAQGQNDGSAFGGGLFQATGAGALTLTTSTFSQNTAQGGSFGGNGNGGGVYLDSNTAPLSIVGSTFSGNQALGASGGGDAEGGGLFQDRDSGNLSVSTTTFSGNTAQGGSGGGDATGGGFYFDSGEGSLSIVASTFANNTAQGGSGGDAEGGGLVQGVETGGIVITRSTFSGNQAVGGSSVSGGGDGLGGGLYQEFAAGNLSLFNSTFGGNSARGGAGTLQVRPGVQTVTVIQPQQQGTPGDSSGGGLDLTGSSTDLLVNDTIARNSALAPLGGFATGGGLSVQGGEGNNTQVWNTLIALNNALSDPDVFGTVVSLGHNLIGNTSGSSGFSAAKHDLLNVAATRIGLGQLAYNGGPTQTMALASTSIAVDTADDAVLTDPRTKLFFTTDQRGLPRKSGAHVDIGAFEFQVPPPPPPSSPPGRRNGPLF